MSGTIICTRYDSARLLPRYNVAFNKTRCWGNYWKALTSDFHRTSNERVNEIKLCCCGERELWSWWRRRLQWRRGRRKSGSRQSGKENSIFPSFLRSRYWIYICVYGDMYGVLINSRNVNAATTSRSRLKSSRGGGKEMSTRNSAPPGWWRTLWGT